MITVSKDIFGGVTIGNLASGQTLYKSSDGGAHWCPVVADLINYTTGGVTALDFTQSSVYEAQPWFSWHLIPVTGTGSLYTYFSGTCLAAAIVSTSNASTGSYFTQPNGTTLPDTLPVTINGTQIASGTDGFSSPIDTGNDDDIGNWMVNWGQLYSGLTSLSIAFNLPSGPFDIHDTGDWNTIDYPDQEAFIYICVSNFYAQTGQEIGYWQGSGTPPTSFDSTVATVVLGVDRAAFLNEAEALISANYEANGIPGVTANPGSAYLGGIVSAVSLTQNPALFPMMKEMFEAVRTYYGEQYLSSPPSGLNNANLANQTYCYDNWIDPQMSCLDIGRTMCRLYYAWKLTGDSYYLDAFNTQSQWVANNWPSYNNFLNFYPYTTSPMTGNDYITASNQYLVLLCGLSFAYLDSACALYQNSALYAKIKTTTDGMPSAINDKGPSYGQFVLGSITTIRQVLGDSDPEVGLSHVLAAPNLLPFYNSFQSTEPCYVNSPEHNMSNTPQNLALRNFWSGVAIDQTAIDIDVYLGGITGGQWIFPTLEQIEEVGNGYIGIGNWELPDSNVVMAGYGVQVDVLRDWGSNSSLNGFFPAIQSISSPILKNVSLFVTQSGLFPALQSISAPELISVSLSGIQTGLFPALSSACQITLGSISLSVIQNGFFPAIQSMNTPILGNVSLVGFSVGLFPAIQSICQIIFGSVSLVGFSLGIFTALQSFSTPFLVSISLMGSGIGIRSPSGQLVSIISLQTMQPAIINKLT